METFGLYTEPERLLINFLNAECHDKAGDALC